MNQETILKLSEKINEPAWLTASRTEALALYNTLPTPALTYGIGINVDNKVLQINNLNPTEGSGELIITGAPEAEILSLKQALPKHEELLKNYLTTRPENKIDALHQAFYNTAIVIRIPPNKQASTPLKLALNLNDQTRIEYIFVIAEPNSKLTIIDTAHNTTKTQTLRSQRVHINANENAHVTYISTQQFDDNVTFLSNKTAEADTNASIKWIESCLGSTYTKSSTTTKLTGQGAQNNHAGLFFGTKNQLYDIDTNTIHAAPHTTSTMHTKGSLHGKAKTIYRGLIKIQEGAHNSKGFQKEDTLLLSEQAQANAVPVLEIHNDNVTCSHGTTISQVDQEKLFYLTSRGLTENEAKQNIVEGFFEPILANLTEKEANSIRNAISELVC